MNNENSRTRRVSLHLPAGSGPTVATHAADFVDPSCADYAVITVLFQQKDGAESEPFALDTHWPAHRCASVEEYVQRSYQMMDERKRLAFRGVGGCFRNLRPSFDRNPREPATVLERETWLLEQYILRAWHCLSPQERHRFLLSRMRWESTRNTAALVIARHHMIDTRCVDWSHCLLCALHFACSAGDGDAEVWWFDLAEFEQCVGAQWPRLYVKQGHVEADIEQDFIHGKEQPWITALHYMPLSDDRPARQQAWITVCGRFATCHAEEIHRLGVRRKGRLVIPADIKLHAIRALAELGVTRESLGLADADRADGIAKELMAEYGKRYPLPDGC